MKQASRTYDRRRFMQAAGTTAIGLSFAGCLGDGSGENVLSPPEEYEKTKDADFPYPKYGEKIPEVTVPAPLHDREVTSTEFIGERHTMFTFIYTTCSSVCPGLVSALRHVQADSIEEGFDDEFAFLPITFDPVTDTEQVFSKYSTRMGVNREAGNWYFLRPESPERAKEVVQETFGVGFQGTPGSYTHYGMILLVNKNGIVERAYRSEAPDVVTVTDDARTLVEEW